MCKCLQERRRGTGVDGEYDFILQLLGELGLCVGLGLAAVAMVLSLHSFVLFRGQKTSFLYAIPNAELEDFRITVILSACGLGLSVLHMLHVQTRTTDVALVDWERPQQVCCTAQACTATVMSTVLLGPCGVPAAGKLASEAEAHEARIAHGCDDHGVPMTRL